MTTVQLYGRLGRAPEQRITATGKTMITASLVTNLGRDAEAPEWFGLVAFGVAGEVLAQHGKGDMLAVSGKLSKSIWTGKDGRERSSFSVLVDSLASVRTVRPGKPRARARGEQVAVPFDDALRF